jgi:hypothetical protein
LTVSDVKNIGQLAPPGGLPFYAARTSRRRLELTFLAADDDKIIWAQAALIGTEIADFLKLKTSFECQRYTVTSECDRPGGSWV